MQSGPNPPAKSAGNPTTLQPATVGLPVRFKILTLNINASVKQVGLTPDGAMDTPKSPDDVAWYKLGPRPGAIGSAVIAGHYGWRKGVPAVFDNVSKLRPGDKLIVVDEKESNTTFTVRELRKYNETADAGAVFASNDGRAHLNLITCAGIYNPVTGRFPDRLVVFADK